MIRRKPKSENFRILDPRQSYFGSTVQSRSCSTSGSIREKSKPKPNWILTRTRSALGHTAVPFPPGLGQTLHLVRCLPLLFSSFLFPSRVLMGAVVLQAGQYRRVKHFLQIFLGQGRALHVGHGSDLHGTVPGVCWVHWSLPVLSQVNEDLTRGGNTQLIYSVSQGDRRDTVTPVLFVFWKVKMSAVTKGLLM